MTKFIEADMMDGPDGEPTAAIDREAVKAMGHDNLTLSKALASIFQTMVPLIRPGHGIGVFVDPESGDAQVIGFKPEEQGTPFYIAWNSGRNEGFISDDATDVAKALGELEVGGMEATMGEAFRDCYGDQAKPPMERVYI